MGKQLRIRRPRRSPRRLTPAEAPAERLTLRSGRRVPLASCTGLRRRRRTRSSRAGSPCKNGSGRRPRRPRGSGERKDGEGSTTSPVVSGESCGERWLTSLSGELKHGQENTAGGLVRPAGEEDRMPPPTAPTAVFPSEAEMEAFFAAAELAERRRFAQTYNYDIALDCPLEGRFEWTPAST